MSVVYDYSRFTNEKQLLTQARMSELQDQLAFDSPEKIHRAALKEVKKLQSKCDHRWLKDGKMDAVVRCVVTEIDDDGNEAKLPKEDFSKVSYRCKHCGKRVTGKVENVERYLKNAKKQSKSVGEFTEGTKTKRLTYQKASK